MNYLAFELTKIYTNTKKFFRLIKSCVLKKKYKQLNKIEKAIISSLK